MAHRFMVPDSSPAPSTPDKNSKNGMTFSFMGDMPSTTPAGPPPSSQASFTPAGAPSESYLGSSIMHGTTTNSKPPSFGFSQSQSHSSLGRNLFGRNETSNAPLGRSIRGRERQPSGLSRQFSFDDEEANEGEDAEGDDELPPHSLFRKSSALPDQVDEEDEDAEGDDVEAQIDRYIEEELQAKQDGRSKADGDDDQEESKMSQGDSDEEDLFLNMRHDDRPYGQPIIGEGDDLIMLQTPAAADRVRREAEHIFKRSSARPGGPTRDKEFQFATIARDMYTSQDAARITESPDLILKTEDLVSRLYDEGVGAVEDAEKMDNSLANITYRLVRLWNDYVEGLPQPEGEDFATVGPGNKAEPFEKATYVANLILRLHHTRFEDDIGDEKTPPLPEVLFNWQESSHNLYPDQVREISRYKPSPACHGLFWQTLRSALLRGDVSGALQLLRNAGWDQVCRGTRDDKAYVGKALENVRRFADATCEMLEKCPAVRADWDIWNSSWTLFRIQARGSLDRLTLFAEGRDGQAGDHWGGSHAQQQPQSMSTMARQASSQIPWDVYENLQSVYGIVLGNHEAILETAQDWCEATVGLLGWWDDANQHRKNPGLSQSRGFGASRCQIGSSPDYFDRLGSAFRLVLDSDMTPNPADPVEVAVASCFEGNVNGVVGLLRTWSLPVASAVTEVASLGQWLPATKSAKPLPTDTLDMDDLALLGILPPTMDEMEGIKDTTLTLYAHELAGIEHLCAQKSGWEMAIRVLGRMDSPQKSEDAVADLLKKLLETLDEKSRTTVDRLWKILNDLGMIVYAEEMAEAFADILCKTSDRYGEALWYYALAHRPHRVKGILNLLMAYSLIESTVFPPEKDMDEDFRNLLRKRTETLEIGAKQDLEAAQLLGRVLSGYATLRKFYEIRDEAIKCEETSSAKSRALKRQAAVALVAVISSADDSIRGGLRDETRDAVVSEDFLLALLGEATVFVNQSPAVLTLDQIDVLLKAVEDLQTVGSRAYNSCQSFLDAVLASGQNLRGSTPADLLTKSTSSLSGSSYVLSGSSMLASRVHQATGGGGVETRRGWDWRKGWKVSTKGDDLLRRLRLGLSKDLGVLWLEDTDGVA
ncbi:uncharacterized protein UV8b_00363 [Ustilaginoidea virens]|uniref:Nuclear pore complex protein Nup85 n=1 Tax=Ustilaginoidea virens TaxID=1159556 RepID=A0A063C0K8_USTVR|nr:uncharacterized protein UV8b_00363 [Ustilaginoidea virens]QUC16122.1 hypothetical protein UV8b_00363 [Ustilaginoidea virens]GAO17945.1 hypothetical protein UVI_02026790 [Ustilaginoidea virens]